VSTAADVFERWHTDPSVAWDEATDDLAWAMPSLVEPLKWHHGRCRCCGEQVRHPRSHVIDCHHGNPTGFYVERLGTTQVLVFDAAGYVRGE